MDLYTNIRNLLIADATVQTLVGVGGLARVYRSWQRNYTTPAIIIQDDSDELNNDLSGHSGFTVSDVAVTCRSDSSVGVDTLRAAVVPLLAGYTGAFDVVIDSIVSSVSPQNIGGDTHWFDWTIQMSTLVSEAI